MAESSADVVIVGGGIAGMAARAAERLVVTVRHGRAIGLRRDGGRITGVILERKVLSCATAVLALGPWSAEASGWIGVPIDVRPLKGQILRLQAPGPPVDCSVGWGHHYGTTKTDGLMWAGTTEEDAGFDEESTSVARDEIGAALLRMLRSRRPASVRWHPTGCSCSAGCPGSMTSTWPRAALARFAVHVKRRPGTAWAYRRPRW